MKKWINEHILIVYIMIAFGISWLGWSILILTDMEPSFFNPWKIFAAFGPSIAGLIVIALHSGRAGLIKIWHSLINLRGIRWHWYLVSLIIPPAIMLAALGIHIALGGTGLSFMRDSVEGRS